MENNQKDFSLIKKLLNNIPLLRWVKKFSANGLQDDDKSETFSIETTTDSISVADKGLVKMFFSSARFKGKRYSSFNLQQIRETLSLIDGEGRLTIGEGEDNKRFCYIESMENVVVIAPFTDADEKAQKGKKEEKPVKVEKKKKAPEDVTGEDLDEDDLDEE